MIKLRDAENYLKNKIGENSSDITKVWEAFKSFGREHVEGEEEIALLFQCGVSDFTGEELFYFDFVRQFTSYDDEEYSHMEQLHCEFVFEPTDDLRELETSQWYFENDGDVEDFFIEIENIEEFKVPMKRKPTRLSVYQEEV
ncbi:hypothetical protein [Priestia abyssalis]|uniref:hypothetical protein n=1 Tax=Priestia abyssalis TaxID=1221450 RepID=UPI000995A1AB|nr:hypothetical protein [Priestia abyssalis]